MTQQFKRGSEWRKWDLHVHVPGTKSNNQYEAQDGEPDFDRFADVIESSDVAVVGVTDYFSADQSLAFIEHFRSKFPESKKLLLVNVELRLNENVNRATEMVNFHVIFRDALSGDKIREFLSSMPTELTDGQGRKKRCSDLTGEEFDKATVSRENIKKAFSDTFGQKAEPTDYLIYLAPSNNDGIRAENGRQRKEHLADEIDKDVHAVFGKNIKNTEFFLKTDRYEDKLHPSKPKPVFGGCDAHSFEELQNWLGNVESVQDNRQVITWVKADPTFEGLQQALVEPGERVSLTELMPDAKDSYRVIKQVTFKRNDDFPGTLVFNSNLNAIIGSRSSGKSALLAHIANAIDSAYTVKQQVLANRIKESDAGPAAGYPWKSVESTICQVEWSDGSIGGGQVVYVPQNWLYQIGRTPREVTEKIQPVVASQYPEYVREHHRVLSAIQDISTAIGAAVARWFELAGRYDELIEAGKQVGERKSIEAARDEIGEQIEALRDPNSLSSEDVEKYQSVIADLDRKRSRLEETRVEAEALSDFVTEESPGKFAALPDAVSIRIGLTPDPRSVSTALSETLEGLVANSKAALTAQIEEALTSHRANLSTEYGEISENLKRTEADNNSLFDKYKANKTLDELVNRQKVQQKSLDRVKGLEEELRSVAEEQRNVVGEIEAQIQRRASMLDGLVASFRSIERSLEDLTFDISTGLDRDTVTALSEPFRKNSAGSFLHRDEDEALVVNLEKAQGEPGEFMAALFSKSQKLNQGHSPSEIARRVLAAESEIRFTATLDNDRIGGFHESTMTPGKQALFALTLILGQADDRWPLLIDQPEDDLDSRSIYGDIVRFLLAQKKHRQIILVTHNANLVVGGDAEEVLVANRHGDDRKNRADRTFDYLTGSLEHSAIHEDADLELERMGVREHAVELLDGGEEAFQKRREKYKLPSRR